MPWPWTFFLRNVQQLGLGMPYSGLLAPFLRHSLGSWISSLCTDRHRAASYIGIPSTYYGLSPTGSSTGRRMDGCIGIGRATTRVPFAEQYDLHWRSSRHWAKGPTDRVDFFVILKQVSRLSSCIEVIQLWYNPGVACLPKSTLLRQGVCVKHLNRCKTSLFVCESWLRYCTLETIIRFSIKIAGELGTLWLTQFNEARSQSGISGLAIQTYLHFSDIARG